MKKMEQKTIKTFEWMLYTTIIMLLIFIFGCFCALINLWFFHPQAAENALQVCKEDGFNSFESFETMPFSTNPLGVKCSHIQNKYEVEGNGIIAISTSK